MTALAHYALMQGSAVYLGLDVLLIGCLLAALGVLLYLHVAYRKVLSGMHRSILQALEGILCPVSNLRGPDRFLRRIVSDHDLLMMRLNSAFTEMEGCQKRVIGERNRNDAILHSLPGALLCVDSDLKVSLSSRQAEDLFGFPRDMLLGRNLFDLLAPDKSSIDMIRDAFLYEQPIVNKEVLLQVGGHARHFALTLSFFKSVSVNEAGAVVIVVDISDYKHLQERIYTVEKLAAIGQLAAGVAHELNTPLGNIIGYARLMDEPSADACQIKKYTQIVLHEAKRCARVVDDLLNYARRDHCQFEVCELNSVVKDVVDTIVDCQGKRYQVDISFYPGPELSVKGSPGQLDIVLVNLMLNAIYATAGTDNPRVTVKVVESGDGEATVIVEDNGPGVPPEHRRRIFDPFFTTKEVGKGTGLGLAISQAIVTKLDGGLRYDSTFQQGARFVLALPLAQQAREMAHVG
ncbi:MAG: ATP-binding protein [Gammaproteobacteria bacterium]|nr:ATP-binding protein [Gammaproteobacteria bacterium]